MTNRWVCARCFTSADESATACPNCGLARGLAPESAAGDAPAGADEPTAPAAPYRAAEPGTSAPEFPAPAPEPAPAAPVAPASQPTPAPDPVPGERWVCRRCFSSNDGWRTACVQCGQVRDTDPSSEAAAGGAGWAPPPPVAREGGRFPWRLAIYGVIALVVVGGSVLFAARRDDSGEITDAGTLSVFDLQVGDCFDAEMGEISEVQAIPCAEPHVYEVYSVVEYPAGELPSAIDENYTQWEMDTCVGRFEDYVGIDFDFSDFYFSTLTPSDQSWAEGDRALMCFLHNSTESPLTGSAQGSAR
ncbi:MAG: septum formation family protein [Candidatus Limnocylindria bacterium]